MKTVSKSDIIRQIAQAHGQTQDNVRASVDALIDAILGHVQAGAKVNLTGLGAFSLQHRPERMGRNPSTGEPVQIAAKDVLKFKPSQQRKA
ncbi:HU family DNA-binding protein [Paracoccus sp. (in: a-proteobacteria)]|uniref:HU family DNA-binding protein n=1 Tax=Paracoccus sp. TaxID=267 RepID=UPI0026DFB874|nr:HU family DNA-binding protein [Paracoccus sp. (in: a-proteobacteria)]MDO5648368.1 HU family DNA-binding protein [Paracoccus sp. (in: a-proteobacteria)]